MRAKSNGTSDRIDLLLGMKRDAERILDHQVQAMEKLDEKAALFLRFGVVLLVAGVGLVSFLLQIAPSRVGIGIFLSVVSGALLNLAGLFLLSVSYLGGTQGERIAFGPSAYWLKTKSQDADWTRRQQLVSVLNAAPGYVAHNIKRISTSARRVFLGLALVFMSALFYATPMIYILLEVMRG